MTTVTLEITPSKTGPNFFLCTSVDKRFGVSTGNTIEEAKLAGELMLYKIKAAQDMALAEGKTLPDTQPHLEHPIEVEFVVKDQVAPAS